MEPRDAAHDDLRTPSPELARLRARFEQAAVPQASLDLSGILVEVNEAFCELLALSSQELLGTTLTELRHPGDADHGPVLAPLLAGARDTAQSRVVLRHTDGRPVPLHLTGSVLRGDDGAPLGIAVFVSDLTMLRDLEERRRRQEEFFLALSQNATDLAIVTDAEGRIVHTSPAMGQQLGYQPEEVLGSVAVSFVHPDDTRRNVEGFRQVVVEGGTVRMALRIRRADGVYRWYEETVSSLLDTAVGGVVCNLRDVTERVEAEGALRASEARYRAIADNADEGLWVVTPEGGTVYANARLGEILGLEAAVLNETNLFEILGSDPTEVTELGLALRGEIEAERHELAYHHPDGAERILRFAAAPLPDDDGRWTASLAMVSDVTEARHLEAQLRRAALHDELTGLPNRALLLDRIEHALSRGVSAAALFVDVDQFKVVNDARGHAVGDELLVQLADRLRSVAREPDTVARFGGDEFVVVCEETDAIGALQRARDIQLAIEAPFPVTGGDLHATVSIGIALAPVPSPGDLLRNADTAMYAAKAAGRRTIRLFNAVLAAAAAERYELGTDLRSALLADHLQLHYQPVVDLRGGRVIGVEALARWEHPTAGRVPPQRFVSLAEQGGLSTELDRWVVCRAIRQAAAMRGQGVLHGDAYVAVNVSPRGITEVGLAALLADALEETGLQPHDVLLEITEGALVSDTRSAIASLHRLRERGYQIAVDDFGTGHSSLSYLRRLPVTTLKIDRSFVADLSTDSNAVAIVTSIVEMAAALNLQVVAEGVETSEQARLLRHLGCPAAQGWLWSPAISEEEARRTGALSGCFALGTADETRARGT